MSTKNNLHPIYVALDQHQYSRAIKLALGLPSDNMLGQALLAVAYQKAGQKEKSLFVIADLLINETHTEEFWFELKARLARTSPPPLQATTPQPTPVKSKGKKNKRKASTASSTKPVKELPPSQQQRQPVDLIQELDGKASFPETWDKMDVSSKAPIIDETILATLSIPMQAMNLIPTVYQMYLGACQYVAAHDKKNTELINALLSRSFEMGLRWLPHSKPSSVQLQILANLQMSALQLARLSAAQDVKKYTAWAARVILWQHEELSKLSNESSSDDEKAAIQSKMQMTLRLAESLAQKSMSSPPTAQDCWLYIDALTRQKKYQEILDWLVQVEDTQQQGAEFTAVHMDKQQIQQQKAEMYVAMHAYQEGAQLYEELIRQHIDDWSYWMGYVSCCFHHGGLEETLTKGQSLVDSILNGAQPPLPRGPFLARVELAATKVRGGIRSDAQDDSREISSSADDLGHLQEKIVEYASHWSLRASCAFSDLEPYIRLLVHKNKRVSGQDNAAATKLLTWAKEWQSENCQYGNANTDAKQERYKLRAFIFAAKLSYLLVGLLDLPEDDTWLGSTTGLLKEWKWALAISSSDQQNGKDDEVAQKENQPGDELILIAVKRLLQISSSDKDNNLYLAASLLELGMRSSPHNAYLAISAMDVYAKLNASWRAWELYKKTLSLKHIQLDSCSYLMLDKLVAGGLYNELVEESGNILKFHASTLKDTGDFLARAMQHGSLNKANEFLVFQQLRMNHSVAQLDAKHYIMDGAALIRAVDVPSSSKKNKHDSQPLGEQHGIIGGPKDVERAVNMACEAKNPLGAPSIVSVDAMNENVCSDNRDVSLLADQMMQPIAPVTREQVTSRSLRCGHTHALLIRAALCVDACKGPKKGKVQKPTEELVRRCNSLLEAVQSASNFCQNGSKNFPLAYLELLRALFIQCHVLVVVTSGLKCSPDDASPESDSLVGREGRISEMLPSATTHLEAAQKKLDLTSKEPSESVSIVCRLLPDCLVAVYALLQIHGNMFATFGWGKRKRKTKAAAGALAEFAIALRQIVSDMAQVLSRLPTEDAKVSPESLEIENDIILRLQEAAIDPAVVKETMQHVMHSQLVTRNRVVPLLDHVRSELDNFDVAEEP